MNRKYYGLWLTLLLIATALVSCSKKSSHPQPKHVVLIGLDAMGSYGVQRAETPNLNLIMKEGAGTLSARSVRPTESSPNWMSMMSGADPIVHGVTSNDWEPGMGVIEPATTNKKGLYPTLFDLLKEQHPEKKLYMFYEWVGQDRMYDTSMADTVVNGMPGVELFMEATEAFFNDRPDFLFLSIVEPDDVGHGSGHESKEYLSCITKYDHLIGQFINRLKETGLDKETVVVITADHGGLGFAHGGDLPAEYTIPILFWGKGVTAGKQLTYNPMITDVAGSLANLLDVKLDPSAKGRFLAEAFTPMEDKGTSFSPSMPFIYPMDGIYPESVQVAITSDNLPGTNVYYTLDGSTPTTLSPKYTGPITLTESTVVRAVAIDGDRTSLVAEADLRVLHEDSPANVYYEKFDGYMGRSVPNFDQLGRASKTGYVHEFSLDEILDPEIDEDHFAVRFRSVLEIEKDALYTFALLSDDGANLYINGEKVVDNDGSHSPLLKRGYVQLSKGLYNIEVRYYENYMGQKLQVYYGSDHLPMQTLPFSKLSRP